MKHILISLCCFSVLALSTSAIAHGDRDSKAICPMAALHHAKELGLSKKQQSEVKKIKEQLVKDIKPLKEKASKDVRAVLSEEQAKKYQELSSRCDCPVCRAGKHRKDSKDSKKDHCG